MHSSTAVNPSLTFDSAMEAKRRNALLLHAHHTVTLLKITTLGIHIN